MPCTCEFKKKKVIYLFWNEYSYFVRFIYSRSFLINFKLFHTSFQRTGLTASGNIARIGIVGWRTVCVILPELLRGPAPQSCCNSDRNLLMNLRNVCCLAKSNHLRWFGKESWKRISSEIFKA